MLTDIKRKVLRFRGDPAEDDGWVYMAAFQPFGWPAGSLNDFYYGPLGQARDELHRRQLSDKLAGNFGRTLYYLRRTGVPTSCLEEFREVGPANWSPPPDVVYPPEPEKGPWR